MKYFFIGFVIGLILLSILINFSLGSKSRPPILFNHKKHQKAGIECNTCHPFFKEQRFSGLPNRSTCMECHKDSLTDNPEEEKIREFHKNRKEIHWERVYQQPDHVFFSHRRHVFIAKIDCKNCHGPVEEYEKPITRPWQRMDMKWCMDCHTKQKASNDCLACHV